MPESSNRRWFRFSLRTLFISFTLLGIVLGWIAYHVHWIRQRHDLLDSPYVLPSAVDPQSSAQAPGTLGVFGESGRSSIRFYMDEHGRACDLNAEIRLAQLGPEMQRAKQLFPEANVGTYVTTRKPASANHSDYSDLIAALQQLEIKNTLRISTSAKGEAEVTTGGPADQTSRRGKKISLCKVDGAWVVTKISDRDG